MKETTETLLTFMNIGLSNVTKKKLIGAWIQMMLAELEEENDNDQETN